MRAETTDIYRAFFDAAPDAVVAVNADADEAMYRANAVGHRRAAYAEWALRDAPNAVLHRRTLLFAALTIT